jgi:hypothetical protein
MGRVAACMIESAVQGTLSNRGEDDELGRKGYPVLLPIATREPPGGISRAQ